MGPGGRAAKTMWRAASANRRLFRDHAGAWYSSAQLGGSQARQSSVGLSGLPTHLKLSIQHQFHFASWHFNRGVRPPHARDAARTCAAAAWSRRVVRLGRPALEDGCHGL